MSEKTSKPFEVEEKQSCVCLVCGKEFAGTRGAYSKADFEKTGWFDAVEATLIHETCRPCLDKERANDNQP